MVQFRRLDPLANASPYQRLSKSPVKSFTLTSAQYDRVQESRPELIVTYGVAAVVGVPNRDVLEVHYAFPDPEYFRDGFPTLFNKVLAASSKEAAPRGVRLSFRDRPNRPIAVPLFWSLALDEGAEWVEMNWIAVPEQPEPDETLEGGFKVRTATADDADVIADIEAEVSGQARLSEDGILSVYENARWLRLITDASGSAVGYIAMYSEPGGWGIIDELALREPVRDQLREPALRWAIAFLRNNGGRRIRRLMYLDRTADITLLRNLGFTAGETGLDYTRPVSAEEVQALIEERQSHGTMIKFGDWR